MRGSIESTSGISAAARILSGVSRYLVMIAVTLALFAIVLLLSGSDLAASFRGLFHASFGSLYGLSEVVVAMIPLLLTALAVALPWRVGLINVGGEGQLYLGAAFATWGALSFPGLPAIALIPIMMLLGFVGGALWALVPALLRAAGTVNETITTLLLNSVAPKVVGFLIFARWHSPMDTVKTANFVPAARLATFFGSRIHLGILVGGALLAAFWAFMRWTRWGLEMRAIGGNPEAARRAGIPVKRYLFLALCVGGGVAGLAGMAQVSGYYGVLLLNFSNGLGFMGFLICWMAGGQPLGIVLMSFVVAVILAGGDVLQLTSNLPFAVINILLAGTLFVVLARPSLFARRMS
jgi:general nucleoside transport system permease protein